MTRHPGPLGAAQGDLDEAFDLMGDWQGPGDEAAAAVYAVDPLGRILMQLRDDAPGLAAAGLWSPFGGGVEPGETLREAAVREFEEETGLRLAPDALRPYVRVLSGRPGRPRIYTYLAAMPAGAEAIRLGEGAGFALWTPRQMRLIPLSPALADAGLRLAGMVEAGAVPLPG
ncbi:NUDIX domain-containing protein [Albimonas sp. CAU 1670]|uniref:NUDIX domain-containing protein n=1 Tax=Albimonas sp. CAU 1670 TaxID=3032599 RepID=UPI0023DC008A|nr:NUDIX domain-containing protein [Albimonas sp. CAU 1670]MDF2234516.1 NUDIX domain-containing protein [Albimonas sp. CAU 1670]